MRFLFVLISLFSSITGATVEGFNDLVKEATQQERRLHKKLLHALQGAQRAVADGETETEEQIQESEMATGEMAVRLVAETDFKRNKRP